MPPLQTAVPFCIKCHRPMRLVHIVPEEEALPELRAFFCKSCQQADIIATPPNGRSRAGDAEPIAFAAPQRKRSNPRSSSE